MGYCCTPLRIDFGELTAVRGSKNERLIERVRQHLAAIAPQIVPPPPPQPGAEPDLRSRWKACLEHLVAGTTPDPSLEALYFDSVLPDVITSYIIPLEALDLSVESSHDLPPDPFAYWRTVEDTIRTHGLGEAVPAGKLVASELPVRGRIGRRPNCITYGYFTPEDVRNGRGVLPAQDWSGVPPEVQRTLEWLDASIEVAAKGEYGLLMETVPATERRGPFGWLKGLDYGSLIAVPGSGDRRLVRRFVRELFGDDPFSEPDAAAKKVLKALREIVSGSRLTASRAADYADALEAICWVLGTSMNNAHVAPAAVAHFNAVDRVLRERGLDDRVSMLQLVFGGPPLDLPPTEDFPAVGHMTPEMVAAAHEALVTEDWSTASEDLQPTLRLLTAWIHEASDHSEGIICFYA